MLMIVGTVRVPPGSVDSARAHMHAVINASRGEEGCLAYSYGEDVLDPGLIHVVERWRDWGAFHAHGNSAHADAWRALWPELGLKERDLVAYEVGEARSV
jgi:quinol monooxygenase YgiN